jgi:hypothetical protein
MLQVEIYVEGQIDQDWSSWFEGLEISYLDGEHARLYGLLPDQTALYTLLSRLYRLGIPLVSVTTAKVGSQS